VTGSPLLGSLQPHHQHAADLACLADHRLKVLGINRVGVPQQFEQVDGFYSRAVRDPEVPSALTRVPERIPFGNVELD